jgi:periplasmic protein TonB
MIALKPEDLVDLRRWAISGAVVVAAYGGAATAVVNWHDPVFEAEPSGAIVLELAPVAAGPEMPREDIQPGPPMEMSDASPAKPIDGPEETQEKVEQKVAAKPIEEPPPETKPVPDPDLAVAPPEEQEKVPQRQVPRPPAPTTAAPQVVPEQTASVPAAPMQALPKRDDSKGLQRWGGQISASIKRNLRFPETSRARREQGVAQVSFVLDRQGRVLESRVVRSAGTTALDQEALAVLQRAQPFPPPPPDTPGERLPLTVPIIFEVK